MSQPVDDVALEAVKANPVAESQHFCSVAKVV